MGCACGKPYALDDSKESLEERLSSKTMSDLRASRSSRREESYPVKDRLDNGCNEERVTLIDKQINGSSRLQGESFGRKRERAEYTSSGPHPRAGLVPRSSEGEQVAAGWPPWLAAVAGEAITGWVPRRADSFEKLDKIDVDIGSSSVARGVIGLVLGYVTSIVVHSY